MNRIKRDQHIYGISIRSNKEDGLQQYCFSTYSAKGFPTNLS